MSKSDFTADKHGNMILTNKQSIDYINYWGTNKSTFDEQKFNVNGMTFDGRTKVEAVMQYAKGKRLLEIGACPGELLRVAKNQGFESVGVATETPYIEQLKTETGCEIIEGFFPNVEIGGKFDTIIAMDVVEHVEDTDKFVNACKKLLNKEGVIILMLPLLEDGVDMPEVHYNPEHYYIYKKEYFMEKYKAKKFDRWTAGHEIIVI